MIVFSHFLGVCHLAAATVTIVSEFLDTKGTVVSDVHVGGDKADTVLQRSLVRSCTWIGSFMFSNWTHSYSQSMCAV